MAAKTLFFICAQAFLIQFAYGQCFGRIGTGPAPFAGPHAAPYGGRFRAPLAGPWPSPLAAPFASSHAVPALPVPALAAPALTYDGCGGVASTGGGFPVTSTSPIAPTGVTVVSENQIEGALAVGGTLPLLGSVAVEGAFSTAGAGAVSYGCGSGEVIITAEAPISTGILTSGPVGPAPAVFGSGLAGPALAGSALAPGRFGSRAGIIPGRGCGCGRAF